MQIKYKIFLIYIHILQMFSYLVENSMYKKKKIECNNLIKDKNPIRNMMSSQ